MNSYWQVLIAIRLKESWNYRFRFNKSGFLLLLLELLPLVIIGFVIQTLPNYSINPDNLKVSLSLLVILAFLIIFANSYLMIERMLFGKDARVDRLLVKTPRDIVFSGLIIIYLGNLRPSIQSFNLFVLALTYMWFPQQLLIMLGLILFSTLLSVTLAFLTVLLIKRFANKLSGLVLLICPVLQITGLLLAIWVVAALLEGNVVNNWFWVKPSLFQSINLWLIIVMMASAIITIISTKLAFLWEEALLLQEGSFSRGLGRKQMQGILRLLSSFPLSQPVQAIIFKEWLVLGRNPITIFRIVIWLLFSLIPLFFSSIDSLIISLPSPLITVFLIWYFCFGELIATTYQVEAQRRSLLWLAAVSPKQLAMAKFIAYLPISILALGSLIFITVFLGLFEGVFQMLIFTFAGVIVAMGLALVPASLSMNTANNQGNTVTEMALEQVPTTFFSISSAIVLGVMLMTFALLHIWGMGLQSGVQKYFWLFIALGALALVVLAINAAAYLLKKQYNY